MRKRTWRRWLAAGAIGGAISLAGAALAADAPQELLWFVAREQLRRLDIDTIERGPLVEDMLIASTGDDAHAIAGPQGGGNVNAAPCFFADGRFVMGEDAGQFAIPPGWGVFEPDGKFVGKLVTTALQDYPEPAGCAIDAEGRLFTAEVGEGSLGGGNGQLILWFPPFDHFPGPEPYPNTQLSENACKLAVDIGAATNIAIDDEGRILVTSPATGTVLRFSGAWPTSPDAAGGCGGVDVTGQPLVDPGRITRESFSVRPKLFAPSGIARAPDGGWYVGDVLFGKIAKYDASWAFVRMIADPGPVSSLPTPYGNPQSMAVDAQGTIYYADLALEGSIFIPDTGSDGKIRRVRFDENGEPLEPEILISDLGFPDGVAVRPGDIEPTEWRTLGGSPQRLYFNPAETTLTPQNVGQLVKRWEYQATAIVTGSPSVATIDLPGQGATQLVFAQDWDGVVHAVRLSDGTAVWTFQAEAQPGAGYPGSASATIERVDGVDRVFIGYGEAMYALDAATGAELWRFYAGTGCRDALGQPPGLCAIDGERNQVESTPAVVNDTVVFGMDVNDKELGKGGVYGVDVRTGHMRWFFDLESGATCRPAAGDAITHYDGYHGEAELGLPAGFLASRPGCGVDRTPTGCANVWSSPAVDFARERLYLVSSNCTTDDDPQTVLPGPEMPPFDEAIFALDFEGNAAWRWRPREIDNADLAFGAVPNLFSIQTGQGAIDVLGVGSKDGTYYVLDRDGVNEQNGVAWNDADPSQLPYWRTQVVPGGEIGGLIASAAADEGARRIYFSTASGTEAQNLPPGNPPQRPTMHALDMDTGAVVWDDGAASGVLHDASYAPTTGVPGLVFTGTVLAPFVRIWDAETGALLRFLKLTDDFVNPSVFSGATVVDGTLLVGQGTGVREDPHDFSYELSQMPRSIYAWCVPGTRGCGECRNGIDDDHDRHTDAEDPGCSSPDDPSEKSDDPAIACDDGLDNDGDGKIDLLDPSCPDALAGVETSQCDDELDNNGDALVDFDDPNCSREWPFWEQTPSCGVGVELALVLGVLASRYRALRSSKSAR